MRTSKEVTGIRGQSYPTLKTVTGAPYGEVNSKIATAPKLKVEDKDKVNNSEESKP